MTGITFQFNQKKAVESILYLSPRVSGSNVYDVCKLLYLSDKVSLEKYGRFIFGESYSALPGGATPSKAYDLLTMARDRDVDGIKVQGEQVISLREPDLDCLSESDVECLTQTINEFGEASNKVRSGAAHDAAYDKAWKTRGRKRSVPMPVESIAELFANTDALLDYLSNRNAD